MSPSPWLMQQPEEYTLIIWLSSLGSTTIGLARAGHTLNYNSLSKEPMERSKLISLLMFYIRPYKDYIEPHAQVVKVLIDFLPGLYGKVSGWWSVKTQALSVCLNCQDMKWFYCFSFVWREVSPHLSGPGCNIQLISSHDFSKLSLACKTRISELQLLQ